MLRRCFVLGLTLSLFAGCSFGQSNAGPASAPQTPPQQPSPKLPSAPSPTTTIAPRPRPQPKRILGMMPNYRAVSAGVRPPPPTSREAFRDATFETFDYSNLIFVGITSLMAEGSNTHPTFGKGIGGFGDYYWHGYLDKAGGNYMVIWALPTALHEDERYYAKGTGSVWSRAVYAASRVVITPNYHGKNTLNGAEIFGRGISQAISAAYYPAQDRTASAIGSKYAYAVGRDALANVFRELWPDISYHVLHMHHRGPAS